MTPNRHRSLVSSLFVAVACASAIAACGGEVPLGTQSTGGVLGTGGAGTGGNLADAAPGTGGGKGGAGGTLVVDAPVSTGGLRQSGGQVGTGGAPASGGQVGTGGQPVTGGVLGSGGQPGTGGTTGTTTSTNPRCGTIAGLGCPAGMFCDLLGCGMIPDAAGICQPAGGGCLTVSQPVCGCDGKTYDNDCIRINAGVLKASDGACAAGTGGRTGIGGAGGTVGRGGAGGAGGTGGVSGTGGTGALCAPFLGINCPTGYFCDIPGCANDAAGNSCVPVPEVCAAVYAPVCGCDGKTHGNDCLRQGAQVRKSYDGACVPGSGGAIGGASGSGGNPGTGGTTAMGDKTCGTSGAIKCLVDGEFCDLDSNCGQIANAVGMCRPTGPEVGCIASVDPVCGCDGKTYSNDCVRAVAGVLKASDDACSADGGVQTYPNGYLAWQLAGGFAGQGPAVVVGPGWADTWDQVSPFSPESPPSSATGTYSLTLAQTDDLFARVASVSTQALPHTGPWQECSISFYFRACTGCTPVTIEHVTATEVAPEMDTVWLWFDNLLGRTAATNPRNYCIF